MDEGVHSIVFYEAFDAAIGETRIGRRGGQEGARGGGGGEEGGGGPQPIADNQCTHQPKFK